MVIEKEVNGVKYEGVLQGGYVITEGVKQFSIVVHDPDLAGGRRRAFLCDPDEVPVNHVVLGTIAIK